nr:hypothetical protein [uncultured Allomuricauda sp.]
MKKIYLLFILLWACFNTRAQETDETVWVVLTRIETNNTYPDDEAISYWVTEFVDSKDSIGYALPKLSPLFLQNKESESELITYCMEDSTNPFKKNPDYKEYLTSLRKIIKDRKRIVSVKTDFQNGMRTKAETYFTTLKGKMFKCTFERGKLKQSDLMVFPVGDYEFAPKYMDSNKFEILNKSIVDFKF